MDLIALAEERRDWHKAELARIEAFLATAFELKRDLTSNPIVKDARTDAEKADAPKRQRQSNRPLGGIGAETLEAAEAIVRERGPQSTRDLLPLVRAKGIEVGGDDTDRAIAILSARLSGKGDLMIYAGKWHFEDQLPPLIRQRLAQKEASDNPGKDQSDASLFHSNEGGSHGTALA